MKKCIISFGTLLLFSAIFWSCSDKSDNNLEQDLSLVQLMEVKANAVTDAVVDISESKGFEIITVEDGTNLKSNYAGSMDSRYAMSITLDDGTDTIRIKVWGEEESALLEGVKEDIVALVIGKIRKYEDEI